MFRFFFSGKLFHKIALIKGRAKSNTYCSAKGQPPKQKHSSKVYLVRSYSENFTNFTRKNFWRNPFLISCSLSVPFEEELHHRFFLLIFAKFWWTLLDSCFKDIANKRKTEWKTWKLINIVGISSCGFVFSNVKSAYCSSLGVFYTRRNFSTTLDDF